VNYGPVRACDIKKFINDGYRADREMRKVTFRFSERVKLIPNDFVYGKYYLLGAAAILFLISGISSTGISYRNFWGEGGPAILNVILAYISGIIVTPLILPYIPVKYFSLKGFLTGSLIFLIILLTGHTGSNILEKISWFFIFAAVSSFLAMNFTGSSTYTSLSGVKKEMKIFLPFEIGFSIIGIILQIMGKLI
jgi:hypothetical protein